LDLIRAYELRVLSVVCRRAGSGPTGMALCSLPDDDRKAVLNITRTLERG
jgi:hypothetical protein